MEARDLVNYLILFVVVTGLIWAGVRFYQDMTRPAENQTNPHSDHQPKP